MPKRKRVQEFKRRLTKAVAEAEAEVRVAETLTSASPLDDIFWSEHEKPWCCIDCDLNHPDRVLNAARDEIDTYLNRR